jgi:hypothetical protein
MSNNVQTRSRRHSRDSKGLERQRQAGERLDLGALESDGTGTTEGESGETTTEAAIDGLGVVSLLCCCAGTLLSSAARG